MTELINQDDLNIPGVVDAYIVNAFFRFCTIVLTKQVILRSCWALGNGDRAYFYYSLNNNLTN